VDANWREHFDRAVSRDPGADPGEMAHVAIARGGRVRRRRRQLAAAGVLAGVVAVLGVVAGVQRQSAPPAAANPPTTITLSMMLVPAPSCSPEPVGSDATDVVIVLDDDRQRAALQTALDGDDRVRTVLFESREQAYERFQKLWAHSPRVVASADPKVLAESFRVRLVDPAQFTAFRAEYAATDGVGLVDGRKCAASAPVGGIQ
jgi:cell division transport system permease protein